MYRISIESTGKVESRETLYTATSAILNTAGGIVIGGTHSRLVAFWCADENKIKAGFGATATERAMIADFGL